MFFCHWYTPCTTQKTSLCSVSFSSGAAIDVRFALYWRSDSLLPLCSLMDHCENMTSMTQLWITCSRSKAKKKQRAFAHLFHLNIYFMWLWLTVAAPMMMTSGLKEGFYIKKSDFFFYKIQHQWSDTNNLKINFFFFYLCPWCQLVLHGIIYFCMP